MKVQTFLPVFNGFYNTLFEEYKADDLYYELCENAYFVDFTITE